MKTNAPEKIYIDANEGWHRTYTAFAEKAKGNDIEYTRTNAFIDKAAEWLKEQDEIIGVSFQEDFLERFKNYMKGEKI